MSHKPIRPPKKIVIISLGLFLTFPFLLVLGSFTPLQAQSTNTGPSLSELGRQLQDGLATFTSYAQQVGAQGRELVLAVNQNRPQSEILGLQTAVAFGLYSLRAQLRVLQGLAEQLAAGRYPGSDPDSVASRSQILDLVRRNETAINSTSAIVDQALAQYQAQQEAQRQANQASIDALSQAFTQQGNTSYDPMATRMTQSANPLGSLPVQTSQATTIAASGAQPTFTFKLVNKDAVSGVSFNEASGIPLTTLSWNWLAPPSISATASAKSYAIIINDPGKKLPPTVSVTLTGSSGVVDVLVDPAGLGGYTYTMSVSTDGTPATVTASGVTGAPQATAGVPGSGTITITGNGIETLVVTVRAN